MKSLIAIFVLWVAFPIAAQADRYIFDPVVKLREQPKEKADYVPNFLPLFGMKNVGPTVVNGEWERFEYVEFPLNNKPQKNFGWIKSKHLTDEPPTPNTLQKLWAKVPPSDSDRKKWLATTAIEIVTRGVPSTADESRAYAALAKSFVNELRNIDSLISQEVVLLKASQLVLINRQGPSEELHQMVFEPLVLSANAQFVEPMDFPRKDRYSTEFLRIQMGAPSDQLKQFAREFAGEMVFFAPGTKYVLYKNGISVGEAQVTKAYGPLCGTCQGASVVMKINGTMGSPMQVKSDDVYLAANFPLKEVAKTFIREPTDTQKNTLISEARKYLTREKVSAVAASKFKLLQGKYISIGGSENLLVASFGNTSAKAKVVGLVDGKSTDGARLFQILKQDKSGRYQVVYEKFLMENGVDFDIRFLSFFDFDGDGLDELIVHISSSSDDGSLSYYEILVNSDGKYRKAIDTGMQSID